MSGGRRTVISLSSVIIIPFSPEIFSFVVATLALAKRTRFVFRSLSQSFRDRNLINLFLQKILNAFEVTLFLFVDKRKCYPVIVGTCRTADAVHIVLAVVRHVEVDNQADIIDVDTTCNDVRAYPFPVEPVPSPNAFHLRSASLISTPWQLL